MIPTAVLWLMGQGKQLDWLGIWRRSIGLADRTPQARGHVVSAVNAVLPSDRPRWLPQTLFNFIASFTTIRHETPDSKIEVAWLCPPSHVAFLVLRAANFADERRPALEQLLIEECNEIFELLTLFVEQDDSASKSPAANAQPDESVERSEGMSDRTDGKAESGMRRILAAASSATSKQRSILGSALGRAASIAPSAIKYASGRALAGRQYLKNRKLLQDSVDALLAGGLSTLECRKLLLLQGVKEEDADRALRAPSDDGG